jgi:uncharacterized protein YqfB (UPF0267 family)
MTKHTIVIRDETESDAAVMTQVTVAAFETLRYSSLFHLTGTCRKAMSCFIKDLRPMANKALRRAANRRQESIDARKN